MQYESHWIVLLQFCADWTQEEWKVITKKEKIVQQIIRHQHWYDIFLRFCYQLHHLKSLNNLHRFRSTHVDPFLWTYCIHTYIHIYSSKAVKWTTFSWYKIIKQSRVSAPPSPTHYFSLNYTEVKVFFFFFYTNPSFFSISADVE